MNKVILFSFLSLIPIATIPTVTLSCSKNLINENNKNDLSENEKNLSIKEPINDEITNNDLKTSLQWISGFKDEEENFHFNNSDFPFGIFEQIFNNDDYLIKYVGHNNDIPYYSLYIKEIKKYYICSLSAEYKKLSSIFTKLKVKNFISRTIIDDFEKNLILIHKISTDDFFVPIDISNESLKFISNNLIKFKSSWGVSNSGSNKVIFSLELNKNYIKEILFGHNREINNFFIEDLTFKDLYILPKAVFINGPTNYFNFNINTIYDNNYNFFYNLTNDEMNSISLALPNKNGNKPQNWSGQINNKNFQGTIVENKFIDGIASIVPNSIDYNYKNISDNFTHKINNSNKRIINNYVDEIINQGKKITINQKSDSISLIISSSIVSAASSPNLMGEWTENGVYNINCLQKIQFNLKEYKKI